MVRPIADKNDHQKALTDHPFKYGPGCALQMNIDDRTTTPLTDDSEISVLQLQTNDHERKSPYDQLSKDMTNARMNKDHLWLVLRDI